MTAAAPLRQELIDVFVEIANIGVGRAAASMSELSQKEVKIALPSVEILSLRDSNIAIDFDAGHTLRINQAISGGLRGQALVLLSPGGAVRLAQILLGRTDASDAFDETEQAALLELGNIMIGGVVGTLVNYFKETIQYDIPYLHLRGGSGFVELLSDLVRPDCTDLLVFRARLSINELDVQSYFLLLLEDERLQSLAEKLENVLKEV